MLLTESITKRHKAFHKEMEEIQNRMQAKLEACKRSEEEFSRKHEENQKRIDALREECEAMLKEMGL